MYFDKKYEIVDSTSKSILTLCACRQSHTQQNSIVTHFVCCYFTNTSKVCGLTDSFLYTPHILITQWFISANLTVKRWHVLSSLTQHWAHMLKVRVTFEGYCAKARQSPINFTLKMTCFFSPNHFHWKCHQNVNFIILVNKLLKLTAELHFLHLI